MEETLYLHCKQCMCSELVVMLKGGNTYVICPKCKERVIGFPTPVILQGKTCDFCGGEEHGPTTIN